VHGLNVVRVIVPPGAAHASGADMVGNDVAVIGELLFADPANAILGNDLPVEELSHLPVRAQLAVSAGVLGIVDAPDSDLVRARLLEDGFSATTEAGVMNGTDLGTTEPHNFLLELRETESG